MFFSFKEKHEEKLQQQKKFAKNTIKIPTFCIALFLKNTQKQSILHIVFAKCMSDKPFFVVYELA